MSVIATVTLNEVKNVIVVPNRFITVDSSTQQATVKVEMAANTYTDVPVTLGTKTDNESEVVSGLTLGQTLVILPTASTTTTTQSGLNLLPGVGGGGPSDGGGPPSGAPPSGGGGPQGGG
jgi:multidrug efflux pump subunit AcrA (membrane-fusion protein)